MKNHFSIYLFLILLMGVSSSCENFLDEINPNGSDADSFWSNLDQTDMTLASAYSTLLNKSIISIREEAWRSDLAVPGFGRPNWVEPGGPWYFQNFNSESLIYARWEALYNGIYRTNQVIEGLEGLKGAVDEDDRLIQMGQARFLRGLYHFYLHCSYNQGNIIIKDKVPNTIDNFVDSISSSEAVLKFFRADLRFAYDNLPATYSDQEEGRATKGAAATILGNSYLYQNEIDSAIFYYEDLVLDPENKYDYELVRDPNLLFTTEGEFNKESILEINYSPDLKQEINIWSQDAFVNQWASYATNFAHSQSYFPTMWLTWEYMNEPLDTTDARNFYTDDLGVQQKRPVSLRSSAMIALAIDTITEYYGKTAIDRASFNAQNGVSRFKQYTNHDIYENEGENPLGTWASGKNVTINRLGEVYINLAECYVRKGEITKALDVINEVRMRWGLQLIGPKVDPSHDYNEVVYDQETLLKRIQDIEKPLETSIEGYSTRWLDLRRWGILEENFKKKSEETYWADVVVYKGKNYWANTITNIDPNNANTPVYKDFEQAVINFNYDKNAWFPIPSTEVATNPGLTK